MKISFLSLSKPKRITILSNSIKFKHFLFSLQFSFVLGLIVLCLISLLSTTQFESSLLISNKILQKYVVVLKCFLQDDLFSSDFVPQVLIDEINIKYSNKVILNYGLCIAFYDFLSVDQGTIFPGDGACHCKGKTLLITFSHLLVRFRYILFRPIEGEVIVGKIVTSNKFGLRISIDFMEDIWIPSHNHIFYSIIFSQKLLHRLVVLPQPSQYDPLRRVWIWSYIDEETSIKEDFEISVNSLVKFKVTGIRFNKLESIKQFYIFIHQRIF